MYKNIITIVVVAILLLFLFKDNGVEIKEVPTIDTQYIPKYYPIYKKGDSIPYKVIDSIPYAVHDTIKIISEYSQIKAYTDTINIDSNTFIINDTISQNKILSRGFEANIKDKVITKTIVNNPKDAIYIGGISNFKYIGIGLQYHKKDQIIGLSINSDKTINLSYYVKIRL